MGVTRTLLRTVYGGGDEAVEAVERMATDWREMLEQSASEVEELQERVPQWISVSERLPEIAPEGVSATVIAAHVGYDLTMQGFVRAGELRSSPADYIVSDENVPGFKSMVNGRWLDVVAWMPLPEPPTCP